MVLSDQEKGDLDRMEAQREVIRKAQIVAEEKRQVQMQKQAIIDAERRKVWEKQAEANK